MRVFSCILQNIDIFLPSNAGKTLFIQVTLLGSSRMILLHYCSMGNDTKCYLYLILCKNQDLYRTEGRIIKTNLSWSRTRAKFCQSEILQVYPWFYSNLNWQNSNLRSLSMTLSVKKKDTAQVCFYNTALILNTMLNTRCTTSFTVWNTPFPCLMFCSSFLRF